VLDLVAAMESCSVRDAAIKLQTWFLVPAAGQAAGQSREPAGKEPKPETTVGKEPAGELVSKGNDANVESEIDQPLTLALRNIDHAHPYITERGITEEMARIFGVGVFPGKGTMHGRCVVPIHNATGELVAYAGRAIDGTEPKYKFPVGFHKSLELYNLHRIPKGDCAVVVVEGFFDCIKVSQSGYPCVALMGCSMSKTQEKFLAAQFGAVVVMLDGDDAGRTAAETIADRLQPVVFSVKTVELPDGVQPDQLSDSQLQAALDGMVY
jgi:DNA primase